MQESSYQKSLDNASAKVYTDTHISGTNQGGYMPEEVATKEEITLESLARRMDMFGEQMNWLCENLAGLFQFVNAAGQNGGGIRGLMSLMKNGGPGLSSDAPIDSGSEVVSSE